MSLEAVCGKNPVNRVGKLYNVAAREIARLIVVEVAGIEAAQCCLVSRIGRAITNPAVVDVAISTSDAGSPDVYRDAVQDITCSVLSRLPLPLERFMRGDVQLY